MRPLAPLSPLLAQTIPGDDAQIAVDDVEPDGEGVEDGSQSVRQRGSRCWGRHAESISLARVFVRPEGGEGLLESEGRPVG